MKIGREREREQQHKAAGLWGIISGIGSAQIIAKKWSHGAS